MTKPLLVFQVVGLFLLIKNYCDGFVLPSFQDRAGLGSIRKVDQRRAQSQFSPLVFFATSSAVEASSSASVEDSTSSTESGRILAEKLKGVNLYLVGAMGSGKSSVGDALCRMMGSYTFVDTDTMIESVTNRTIPDIFAQDGEDSFRAAESSVLEQVAAFVRLVVSTGGGIVVKQRNWASLRNGVVVWLNPSIEILQSRLDQDSIQNRPLLTSTEDSISTDTTISPQTRLADILEDRKHLYDQADLSLSVADPDELPTQTAERLISEVLRFLADNPPRPPPSS